MNPEREV